MKETKRKRERDGKKAGYGMQGEEMNACLKQTGRAKWDWPCTEILLIEKGLRKKREGKELR